MSSRAERRRLEREIGKVSPMPGVGQGWVQTRSGRRYPVREPGPVDLERLIREANESAARLARRGRKLHPGLLTAGMVALSIEEELS